ncbi:MAG: hypothetical protein QOH25_1500 [Acidobacteriota bacterium]|jgi:hypothetical protein|nr:hypothetical protein [Acidobacteriota bacterium]
MDVDDEVTARLADVLGCKSSELSKYLSIYGKAALLEYIEMFCGNMSLRMAVDTREQRLLQIILAAYEGNIPDEATVARLFHFTRSQARSLLRAVLEKKAFELKDHVRKACITVLQAIAPNSSEPIEVMIKNQRVLEALNQLLADDGRVPLLERTSGAKYKLDKASLAVLQKCFEMDGGRT